MSIEKMGLETPNITNSNVEQIAALFPNVMTEGKDENGNLALMVDWEALKQELSGSIIDGSQERYRLDWPGKREAMLAANTPITKTLRPCREESVDFDNTQNLFIEGDNLDALKLLQESYLGKVKMIYIDPPYNTGNDFVYKDKFVKNKAEYEKESGQRDGNGELLVANPETNGRYHSDWLSMIYPRLKLARNILEDNGIILISIDDNEQANLKRVCEEVFGLNKFIAQFVWKSRQNKDNRNITGASIDHEYVLCFGKKIRGADRNLNQYKNPDNDSRGDWASANMVGILPQDQRPNCHYDLIDSETGINYGKPKMGWRYDINSMTRLATAKKIIWPISPEGRPRRKLFLNELKDNYTGFSSIIGENIYTRNGTIDLNELFDYRAFDFPKPVNFIQDLVIQALDDAKDSIILDFFAGSGTTAHAIMQLNSEDGGTRKHISVQLPEIINEKSEAYISGNKNIAMLSRQRIKKAGKKIFEKNPNLIGKLDVGFRVLKIDSSNMNDVYYSPSDVEQKNMLEQVEHVKQDRTAEDLLFQVMLDWAVDLSLPIQREMIDCKTVYFVGDNDLAACFDMKLTETVITEMANRKPLRAVFRDDGFDSSDMKINASQLFKQITDDHTDMKVI